jgi:hypothetical protein
MYFTYQLTEFQAIALNYCQVGLVVFLCCLATGIVDRLFAALAPALAYRTIVASERAMALVVILFLILCFVAWPLTVAAAIWLHLIKR